MKGKIEVRKEKMQKISFWITKQTYRKLKRKAKGLDIPISSLYSYYLERGFEADEKGEKVSPRRLLEMQARMETYNRLRSALEIAEMPDRLALDALRVLRDGKLGFSISKEQFKEFVELVNYFRESAGDQGFLVEEEE